MENRQDRIRPFDWRDFLLIQRLQGRGKVLDYERAMVDGTSPLRDALHAYLPLSAGSRRTLVLPGKNAFAQYVYHQESKRVSLTYLAPAPTGPDDDSGWVDLLEQLTARVGGQDIHHIVAEAGQEGPEMELLRRVGFGVFTRQTLFRWVSSSPTAADLPSLPGLRPWRSTDNWGVRLLYANTVPQLAQQIEAPVDGIFNASRWPHRLVLERDGETIACLVTRRGRVGHAMRLILHPEADVYVEALICHGLATLSGGSSLPVYCRVRRYESWLRAPLEASGFEPLSPTVLLVKHTVSRVLTPEWERLPVLEQRAEMTTPLAHTKLQNSSLEFRNRS